MYIFSVKFHSSCMQHVNAIIMPVYWYFYCDFQQKYRLVLYTIRLCAIAVIRWRIVSTAVAIHFLGGGHWTWSDNRDIGSSLSYPQPTRGSGRLGESPKLPRRGLGQSCSGKRCLDVLYAIFCDFRRVSVHVGSWLSGITPKNTRKCRA